MEKVLKTILLVVFVASCQALPTIDAPTTVRTFLDNDRDTRIIGGLPARVFEFPHMVALILHVRGGGSSFCGGSIIHPSYVLTVSDFIN
jgi:secreted trypsin-like serine protease